MCICFLCLFIPSLAANSPKEGTGEQHLQGTSLNLWVSSRENYEEKHVHWGAPFPHYSNLERTLTHRVTSGGVGQAGV